MKSLANLNKFAFTFIFALASVISWGQNLILLDPLAENSEDNPYLITEPDDWNILATDVNGGYDYSGKYIRLENSIELNVNNGDKMVGVFVKKDDGGNRPFNGTFDGNFNTIDFTCGTNDSPNGDVACTLFRYTTGSTIKNLKVTGTIVSSQKYAAGFIGWAQNSSETSIINCISSINIICDYVPQGSGSDTTKWYDCTYGGLVGQNESGTINITNCIFDGTIEDTRAEKKAQKCAGFIGWANGTKNYTDCTMAGTIDIATANNLTATYHRGTTGTVNFTRAYYINNYSNQGTAAPTEIAENKVLKKYTVDEESYYIPEAVITGFETTVFYGDDVPATITPGVKYYGWTLTRGTDKDYVITVNDTPLESESITLSASGDYVFTIEGKGNYAGVYTQTVKIVDINTWAGLQAVLADNALATRTITLSSDVSPEDPAADGSLEVNGTVILNLNNHVIDRKLGSAIVRGQVIRINNGANLTINGSGSIKGGYNIAENATEHGENNDGGGIYNMGTLTLNNVTVSNNTCLKEAANSTSRTARGGGIYSGSGSYFNMTGGVISSNNGRGGGGGIYGDDAAEFNMNNVTVEWNYCESKGAGVRVNTTSTKTAYMTNCIIRANFLDTDGESKGGGVYMGGGNLVMNTCTIQGNSSNKQGSGFFLMRGTTTAVNCEICDNGTSTPSDENLGAGVCLYKDGSNTSVYIMDGGSIHDNNSMGNGGGIYVYDGAEFKIKGDVKILDNVMGNGMTGSSVNNVYLGNNSVIEVVDTLGDDAIIHITPNGYSTTYISFAEGVSGEASLPHFEVDSESYSLIINNDGNAIIYDTPLWNNPEMWDGVIATVLDGNLPTSTTDVTLKREVRIPSGYVAYANSITYQEYGAIVIEDGGQLVTGSAVTVKTEKEVVAASNNNKGWYLISSGVNNTSINDNTNLIRMGMDPYYGTYYYDLYRFNEAAVPNAQGEVLQWENYRSHSTGVGANFTTLENGRGYLYRNASKYKISIEGTLNVSEVTYNLTCSGAELTGFNLIGNPYTHNIYKGAAGSAIPNGDILEEKYYVLEGREVNETVVWDWYLNNDGTAIPPMTGILVQAKSAGTLTMANSTSGASGSKGVENRNIWFTVANSSYMDEACVELKEGHGLNKIERMNEDAPMLYVRCNGEDFASVDMDPETKSFNLNFEAKTMGQFTLSWTSNGEFSYLHLFDKLTGKDVDLLAENEYAFIGSSADNADRFVVRLANSANADGSDIFAYQSGNDIVVEGEGELHVFDVTGRLVSTQHVNGMETIEKPAQNGVYILRLNGKTQKIVVR